MITTLGQALINEALPPDLRDYKREWTKKAVQDVMQDVAAKHPDLYKEVSHKLMRIGQSASTTGNISYSLKDFMPSRLKKREKAGLSIKVQEILNGIGDEEGKNSKVVELLGGKLDDIMGGVMDEGVQDGNRLAEIINSGSKGSPGQYNTTVGIPLLFTDHRGDPIPVPILNSASEGLDPVEFFASTFGTRKGVISTKFATQDAGAFAKQLAKANQRLVVTEDDCGTENGITVDGYDDENVGTFLQRDAGDIQAGRLIGTKDLKKLKGKQVVVRSPITCQAEHGVCASCAGVRDRGSLPEIGDNIGISASQSLSERLSQGSLNVKHGGGALTKKRSYGFEDVNRLFQMPKRFPGSAAIASMDGVVKEVKQSEGGGAYVMIGEQPHYVDDIEDVEVKVGDHVEAGDTLSGGIVNPKELATYSGIGVARRSFVDEVRKLTSDGVSRRNAEVLARSVVSHVRVNDLDGPAGTQVGDVTRYDDLVRGYKPRTNSHDMPIGSTIGKYLEKPTLHYTIGTRVTNRVAKDLKTAGVSSILVNDDTPSFDPDVQRIYSHPQLDPDWMTRLSGTELKKSLLKSVHEGASSTPHSTSFVPALATGIDFGKTTPITGEY